MAEPYTLAAQGMISLELLRQEAIDSSSISFSQHSHTSEMNIITVIIFKQDCDQDKSLVDNFKSNSEALSIPTNIVRVLKSRRLRGAGHVARMEEGRSTFNILTGKPTGNKPLGRPRRRSKDNIRIDLEKICISRGKLGRPRSRSNPHLELWKCRKLNARPRVQQSERFISRPTGFYNNYIKIINTKVEK